MWAFLRFDLLHQLTSIERAELAFVDSRENLTLLPIEEQIVKFINIHLDTHINMCVILRSD